MKIKVIGLGGIGSHLISPLCRFVNNAYQESIVTFFDGDSYELKNSERQEFDNFGNKAVVSAERMKDLFPLLNIEAKPWYVTGENIFLCVEERDVVFLCPDNHATRKIVSNYCQELNDVTLISGGNDYTDGNVQIYVRQAGKNITPPLTYLHPEIANPADKNPEEMSCEELAASSAPQLIFTNFIAAGDMLAAFWNWYVRKLIYSEQYFDLTTGMARAIMC